MTVLGRPSVQIARTINRLHRLRFSGAIVERQPGLQHDLVGRSGRSRRTTSISSISSCTTVRTTVRTKATVAQNNTTISEESVETPNKSIFSKLYDKYSVQGQQRRIELGERLFRAAQWNAMNPSWYGKDKVSTDFRPQHALITMHVWFLHRRLIADTSDPHFSLLVQEELFDVLWNDTRARIRAAKVHELTVNKHLKDAQQASFLQCTQYDHAYLEFKDDPEKRFEVICDAVWRHILGGEEDASEEMIKRLGAYIEYQMHNIVYRLPDDYFFEGRVDWGKIPDFSCFPESDSDDVEDESIVKGIKFLPSSSWVQVLTDAGQPYYWNTESNETRWKKPL